MRLHCQIIFIYVTCSTLSNYNVYKLSEDVYNLENTKVFIFVDTELLI
jgi:hypothetical protein